MNHQCFWCNIFLNFSQHKYVSELYKVIFVGACIYIYICIRDVRTNMCANYLLDNLCNKYIYIYIALIDVVSPVSYEVARGFNIFGEDCAK